MTKINWDKESGKPMPSKSEIVEALKVGIVGIKFTKADGSSRTMKSTLLNEFIPLTDRPMGESVQHENVIACIDRDIESWRSFRLDRVLSINTL